MSTASEDSGQEAFVRSPAHPVPTLQGPFEESMLESVYDAADYDVPVDAVTRRTMLLEAPTYERIIAGRWKQKPGEKYHPLWKLVAQMTFGLHLLARGLAKSEDEVMKILQAHVDDIDNFLERTSEDFELAHSDMYERLRCLKLPLQHGEVFDRMLEDRAFRASILEGNEKIEHIVSRTKRALKDAMKDVQKGFDAANVLDTYITGLSHSWHRDSPEHEAVHVAMLGNVEGWKRAFMDLHLEGNKVGGVLKKLLEIVAEMEKRAASASRNQLARSQSSAVTMIQDVPGARGSAKPLPVAPGTRNSTRDSSRGTNMLRDLTGPFSEQSQNRSSAGSTQSRSSQQLHSGRQTPSTALSTAPGTSRDSPSEARDKPIAPKVMETFYDDGPVELPADVPEEILRQAPVSSKNRLSYTLGLIPKDNSDHRISSIYYPRALGDLLKMQASPPVLQSPQRSLVRQEPTPSSSADYFSGHVRGSSITLVPINTSKRQSAIATPEHDDSQPFVEASPSAEEQGQDDPSARSSVMSSPGLNSHPSVMSMATAPPPPAELATVSQRIVETGMSRHSTNASKSSGAPASSLGEPGPEIASSEFDSEERRLSHLPTFKVDAPSAENRSKFISGIDLPETVMHSLAAQPSPEQKAIPFSGSEADAGGVTPSKSIATNSDSSIAAQTPRAEAGDFHAEKGAITDELQADVATPDEGIAHFIAELEADVPSESVISTPKLVSSTVFSDYPVEMEAPAAHFVLPSRASAREIKVNPAPPEKDRRSNLRARAETSQTPATAKPKESTPSPPTHDFLKPLKLKLNKIDGKLVPVEVPSPGAESSAVQPVRSPRLSTDIIASIIDQMSNTPSTSPILEDVASESSPGSAKTTFGPPDSAPAPPAPGGRTMVIPDYASAGAFDGERKKQSPPKLIQRHSAGVKVHSMTGLKELISNAASRRHSIETTQKSNRHSISTQSANHDMMDSTTGKDVLWFKNLKEKTVTQVGV